MTQRLLFAGTLIAATLCGSCFRVRPSSPGGATYPQVPRHINPADIALEPEYTIEPVGFGLTYPTGVAFDDQGRAYVVESGYAYGEDFTKPRLIEVTPESNREIAAGDKKRTLERGRLLEGRVLRRRGGRARGRPDPPDYPGREDHSPRRGPAEPG